MAVSARLSSLLKLGTGRLFRVNVVRHGSIVPFKLSDIGEGIREVTVKEWFVKPGDKVSQFDEICEVQSDKASVTITSRYDGHIKRLHYEVDEIALVGDALVDIELHDTEIVEKVVEVKNDNSDNIVDAGKEPTLAITAKVLTTPAVRRIAAENNVKLNEVPATGRDGRVLKEDILAYLEMKKKSSNIQQKTDEIVKKVDNEVEIVTLKGYEKHMWKTMTQALSIPHFVYSDECDVTKLLALRNDVKEYAKSQGVSVTFMPFFIKAASKALEKYPKLNAWLDEESQSLKVFKRHNISLAMQTPEGLVVPNIKDVQNLSITDIAKELNRLQELGKKAALPLADLSGGTFSLSNIGVVGGTYTKPVILPPQIVIGALGKIQKLPRYDADGNIIPANLVSVSWAADHRVVDGVTMAQFSNLWKYYVENPNHLLI